MIRAEVFNGQIVRIHSSLPKVWKNISNFHLLSHDRLKDLSWCGDAGRKFLPVEETAQPEFNHDTQRATSSYVIDLDAEKVIRMWTIDNFTEEEIASMQEYNATMLAQAIEEQWRAIRENRNQLLTQSDWTVMTDSPLSTEQREAWVVYRQQLRDLPQQFSTPDAVVFPDPPTETSGVTGPAEPTGDA